MGDTKNIEKGEKLPIEKVKEMSDRIDSPEPQSIAEISIDNKAEIHISSIDAGPATLRHVRTLSEEEASQLFADKKGEQETDQEGNRKEKKKQ
jgi:hypothetical protein